MSTVASRGSSWVDLFYLTRPTLIFVAWVFPLAGARGLEGEGMALLALLLQYFCILGSAFIINQLHDLESDRLNGKCETLSAGLVDEEKALRFSWVLLLVGLALALGLGLLNLLLTLAAFILTAVFYNKPPLSAKDRPLMGPLLLSMAYGIAVVQGAALGGWATSFLSLWSSLPMVLAGFGISLLTTVPDLKGDRATGKRSFAVVFGVDRTWIASAISMALAAVLAWIGNDLMVAIPAALSSVLLFHGLFTGPEEKASRVARLSILLMGVALVPAYPWLLPLMALYLLLARRYYRDRFNLSYPSL